MQSRANRLQFNDIYIIGCGGVASYLLPSLLKVVNPECAVTLLDGDKLEERNLDRQLFDHDMIGKNKAWALAEMYGTQGIVINAVEDYFSNGFHIELNGQTAILGCADNHTARREIIRSCDFNDVQTILGGNEFTDAEAYYYDPSFRGSPLDPRIYYPEILTDTSGDPTQPAGCTGLAQEMTPQLALANNSAACYMLHLIWFWNIEFQKMDARETFNHWPIIHRSNFCKMQTVTSGMLRAQFKEKSNVSDKPELV